MVKYFLLLIVTASLLACSGQKQKIVFDVHLHGDVSPKDQISSLKASGVKKIAISTSWNEQQQYVTENDMEVLHGLMVPCPAGRVPYSLQQCFEDGKEWPDLAWVEQQIRERKIDFIGEVLTQYQGISSSDSMMFPYYALAEKYGLPVGIHTGSAGPDHGCPKFREDMGDPELITAALLRFPRLKVWLMHGGAPFVKECMELMKTYPGVYADISVLNNSRIVPSNDFSGIMKGFIDSGLEDRLMFGSDNAPIQSNIDAVEKLGFLTADQKEKIFYINARTFFGQAGLED